MKKFFKSLSGNGTPDTTKPAAAKMLAPETPAPVRRIGTTLPIVDWDAMRAQEPPTVGEGPWEPKPELWKDGVERGQF